MSILHTTNGRLLLVLLIVTLGVGGYGYHKYTTTADQLAEVRNVLASSTSNLENRNQTLAQQVAGMNDKVIALNDEVVSLTEQLEAAREENEALEEDLEDEQERNDELEEQVEEVTDSVGNLQNTVDTEPELLKKYSRTFFLNENYEPAELEEIDEEYVRGDQELRVDDRVWPYLEDLLEEAHDDDIELLVTSAYRPFGEQAVLNDRFNRVFGEGANQFSAQQGYSEHQLGTTIDFVTPEVNELTQAFADTEAFEWLEDNAHEYGFVLSYPEGNRFYIFEPWHWRFVGEELAEDLDDDNDYLYDWSQREIDSYRSEMFD